VGEGRLLCPFGAHTSTATSRAERLLLTLRNGGGSRCLWHHATGVQLESWRRCTPFERQLIYWNCGV
jgi:hypothetical protein